MARLAVVELHRGADDTWEVVRGGTKPAGAAAAAAATPATALRPGVLAHQPQEPPRFLRLEDLFAELLNDSSQLQTEFQGGCCTHPRRAPPARLAPARLSLAAGAPGDPAPLSADHSLVLASLPHPILQLRTR